ncbi:stage II sporulation protein M [Anoxybacter fermentans]|uniref:Stage II sporulation protein M n=1 Tax=Anoxybacter fermentans TaxID=1323375 RepID=A0A3S9SYT7_9FIRM|nr:stage II sporulation protein M [Anoxybacter fermentans]AZR73434.1 stage II sporulation protein M [Anoxybacter fermentans]
MKLNRWQQGANGFLFKNLPIMFFVLFIFIAGVVFGALAIRTLDYIGKKELVDYLSTFFNGLAGKFNDEYQVNLWDSIWLNIKTIIIMWLLGLSLIGMPLIPGLVFLRGFVIGFTVGFLVHELSFKGMLFALVSILPQNLIIVPATILAGVIAIFFSITILKSLITKRPINFGHYLISYSVFMILIGGMMVVASLIEAFITPVFMELAVRLLIKN